MMNPILGAALVSGGAGLVGGWMDSANVTGNGVKSYWDDPDAVRKEERKWFLQDRNSERRHAQQWRTSERTYARKLTADQRAYDKKVMKEARQYARGSLDRLRDDAQGAGFNPLTVLGVNPDYGRANWAPMAPSAAAGAIGATQAPQLSYAAQGYMGAPPLASNAFIGDALNAGISTYFNAAQMARDEEAQAIQMAIFNAELQEIQNAPSRPYQNFGYNIPSVAHSAATAGKPNPEVPQLNRTVALDGGETVRIPNMEIASDAETAFFADWLQGDMIAKAAAGVWRNTIGWNVKALGKSLERNRADWLSTPYVQTPRATTINHADTSRWR